MVVGRIQVHDGAGAPDGAHELVRWRQTMDGKRATLDGRGRASGHGENDLLPSQ